MSSLLGKKVTTAISVVVMFTSIGFQDIGTAAENRISAQIQTTVENTLNKEEKRYVSLAAGRILKHVNQARFAIAMNAPSASIAHVEKALTLVDIIKSVAPVYSVEAKIEAGDIKYEDTDRIRPLYVTIHDELDRISVLSPVMEAKKMIADTTGTQSSGGPLVSNAYLSYTRVFFDVAFAEEHLLVARNKLNAENMQLADRLLLTVQLGVLFEYKSMDLPLTRASENLLLAKTFFEEKQIPDSKIALQAAVEALNIYEKRIPRETAGEVGELRSEIVSYIPKIAEGQVGVTEKITGWWDRLVVWFA